MTINSNKPCPSCESIGKDRTGDHLIIFDDGGSFCTRCKFTYNKKANKIVNPGNFDSEDEALKSLGLVSDAEEWSVSGDDEFSIDYTQNPYSGDDKFINTASDVQSLPCLSIRDIPDRVVKKYGVHVKADDDGNQLNHYYPVHHGKKGLVTYKVRNVSDKRFYKLDKGTPDDVLLFGQNIVKTTPNTLVITEGEIDAMAANAMLSSSFKSVAVVSLPWGASSSSITDNIEFLKNQKNVVLAYDQDKAGLDNEDKTWELLPNVKVMRFSEKDPSDMLINMKTQEFVDSLVNAKPYCPRVVVNVEDIDEATIISPVSAGLQYPWNSLTKMTHGIMPHSLIGIGASPGCGKSLFIKAIQQDLMFNSNVPVGIISLEESPDLSLRLLVGYMMNKRIHIPGINYSQADAKKLLHSISGKAFIYEHKYYKGKWENIEFFIRYMYSKGVKHFFIDPLSGLVSHLDMSEGNKYIGGAMYSMSKLIQSLDIVIFHVNHLNTASNGASHESGARVFASQYTGSRAQWRYSTGLFGLERDQLNDDTVIKNTMFVRMLKDRTSGSTGNGVSLLYDTATGRLVDGIRAHNTGGF